MRIVCISDTHSLHDSVVVPEGDVLIHAGDHCNRGTRSEVKKFDAWLAGLPHPHKWVIAGNHDWPWQKHNRYARHWLKHGLYLQDSGSVLEGIKVWGSPWQPEFCNWAFNLPRGYALPSLSMPAPATNNTGPSTHPLWWIYDVERQSSRHYAASRPR